MPVPPDAITEAVPSESPQAAGVLPNITPKAGGSVMVILPITIQPEVSLTDTLNVPAPNPVAVLEVCDPPSSHVYVYGGAPPEALAVPLPSFAPLQETSVESVVRVGPPSPFTTVGIDSVHPLASVIVTEYTPAINAVSEEPVCPFDQR